MVIAGLEKTASLFLRPMAKALWKFLESEEDYLNVEGPPATGKSALVWAWACWKALNGSKILWLHLARGFAGHAVEFDGKELRHGTFLAADARRIISYHKHEGVKIVIVTKDTLEIRKAATVWVGHFRIVCICSAAILIPSEQDGFRKFRMTSWTIKEYHEACNNPTFYESIKENLIRNNVQLTKEEHINNKFFLAGHCARWFFGMTFKDATEEIDAFIESVSNIKDLIEQIVGPKSNQSVNHLCSSFLNKNRYDDVLVSEYVVRRLMSICSIKVIKALFNCKAVRNNPSFSGWLVELEFLVSLRVQCDKEGGFIFVKFDSVDEQWPATRYIDEFDPTMISEAPTNTWLIPKKWNQAAFDFVQVDKDLLRVVQVTTGSSHSYKLKHVCDLLKNLRKAKCSIAKLDVVVVVPTGKKDNFKVEPITGHEQLGTEKNYEGQRWTTDSIRILEWDCEHIRESSFP